MIRPTITFLSPEMRAHNLELTVFPILDRLYCKIQLTDHKRWDVYLEDKDQRLSRSLDVADALHNKAVSEFKHCLGDLAMGFWHHQPIAPECHLPILAHLMRLERQWGIEYYRCVQENIQAGRLKLEDSIFENEQTQINQFKELSQENHIAHIRDMLSLYYRELRSFSHIYEMVEAHQEFIKGLLYEDLSEDVLYMYRGLKNVGLNDLAQSYKNRALTKYQDIL